MQANDASVTVSVVVPVYRGRDTLSALAERLHGVRDTWARAGMPLVLEEVIFVDDGSSDGSAQELERLTTDAAFVRTVTLSRNFGQHPATAAGILHTSGDWVVTLDEDLQHPPDRILDLLRHAVLKSHDVVYASPLGRVHSAWHRDLGSRAYKVVLAAATGNPHVKSFNSFRVVRGAIARAAAAVVAHDTFLDVAVAWFTARVGTVPVDLTDPRAGASGYSLRRLVSHARRAVISSQAKWLRIGAGLGLAGLLLSLSLLVWTVGQRLLMPELTADARGWASLMAAITFFGGLTALLVGVALEYISTVVLAAQGKPTFFVVDRSSDEGPRRYFRDQAGE